MSDQMDVLAASTHNFLQMLAGSTEKEASLVVKYAKEADLLVFRDIAAGILGGKDPLPDIVITFHGHIRSLAAAKTVTDVRKIFLGDDPIHHTTTALDFFIDLADANERDVEILMRRATDKHLFALRDTAMELLVGKIPFTKNQEDALEPFWAEIRELALSKNAKEISKNLFWHFGGRLPLIQGIVIPSLMHTSLSAIIVSIL